MRVPIAVSMLVALTGCYLSHELGDRDASVGRDAAGTDAATCIVSGDPEWQPVAGDPCGLAVARHPERLLSLCWGPCDGVTPAAACRAAPLGEWSGGDAAEHDDVAYFFVGRFADRPPYVLDDLVIGTDGSARTAISRRDCLRSGVAYGTDAWAFALQTEVADRDAGRDTVYLHWGALDDAASWSVPRAVVGTALIDGVATPERLAVTGLEPTIFTAAGGATPLAPLRAGDEITRIAAIVDDRAVWLEHDATHVFVVQRRGDGTVETLIDDPAGDVLALGVDGPAYVWTVGSGDRIAMYSATITVDPGALRPRRVDELVTPDWTVRPDGRPLFVFDHGRALIAQRGDAARPAQVVVVELGTGLAWSLTFATGYQIDGGAIETPHRAALSVTRYETTGLHTSSLLSIDLDALTPLFHSP